VRADLSCKCISWPVHFPYTCCMSNQHEADTESLRLELQESTTTFRHQIAILTQVFGIIATADSVLLAYGFTQRQSGILLVASVMPIIGLIMYSAIMTGLVPITYIGMRLERKLALHEESLITT